MQGEDVFTKLLRGFRGKRRRSAPDAVRPARVAEPTPGATPEPEPQEATPEGAAPWADAAVAIHHELVGRSRMLRDRFAAADEEHDVPHLLKSLNKPGGQVRQPPLAAQAVLTLLDRPGYGTAEMTRLIERDPALSQGLLRHANSAWYAGFSSQPLLSIKAAIQRVGNKGVHAAVMQQMINGELSRPGAGLDRMAGMVWQHMIRVAPIARALSDPFDADADDAFTLGLLHDVGKLLLFDRVSAERKHLRRNVRMPYGFVPEALNQLHELLGGLAVLEWGLDDRSAQIVATHHRRDGSALADPLSEVVFVAEQMDLARAYKVEPNLEAWWEEGELTGPMDAVEEWLAEETGNAQAAAS